MKLLLLNLNTSTEMTALIERTARQAASVDAELCCLTARFGARYIGTRATVAVAAHAALDLVAEHIGRDNPQSYDAIVLACFGEPGIAAVREMVPIPVIGLAEASMRTAAEIGGRYAIITGGERWAPMLREYAGLCGLSESLAAILPLPQSGTDISRDPGAFRAAITDLCHQAVESLGVSSVILGGAGLAGIATAIRAHISVPVLDSIVCGIQQAEASARTKSDQSFFAPPAGVETEGLSSTLRQFLVKAD